MDQLIENPKTKLKKLSGGQKQMLILILAFGLDYPLIIFDEPENNLDEKNIIIFRKLLMETKKDVILISHNEFDDYERVVL